ncbi:hypothetical protein [Rhodoplanes sp. Z2-YC6860]|uniref:hypothetical protein n=1 Tax=Rhodoplanes sp. Z2-YC6860 TaxID=674703 RepID=UPI0008346DE8|nr:hypothetical protein [Rhodoplanes sp. Z2-YC6860]
MIRTVLLAVAAIAATAAVTDVAAQSGAPVRKLDTASGTWIAVRGGEQHVSHCIMGPRSEASNPQPGKPQFMIAADREIVLLRVRAADWSFSGARDIAVTLVTGDGAEFKPAAAVHGRDLIDIDLGTDARKVMGFAAQTYVEIRTEGTIVRLPLNGVAEVLPAYRACLTSIGNSINPEFRDIAVQ